MSKWQDTAYKLFWWDHKCRWPEYVQHFDTTTNYDDFINGYTDRVKWINENIDSCERHCRWSLDGEESINTIMIFKFRHETDMTRFILRWS